MEYYFDHEKFNVYQRTMDFIEMIETILNKIPTGRAYLSDQLKRADTSIALNIAEGAGEFSPNDKKRFYRMARRSATECAAIIDICFKLKIINKNDNDKARNLLVNIVRMLIKLSI